MKKEKPEGVALPTVSKVSLDKVHEKQSLETPEMAKKSLYSVRQATFSAPQICKEVQKPYKGKSRDDYLFFDQCPKYIFFQLPNLQNDIVWGSKSLLLTR